MSIPNLLQTLATLGRDVKMAVGTHGADFSSSSTKATRSSPCFSICFLISLTSIFFFTVLAALVAAFLGCLGAVFRGARVAFFGGGSVGSTVSSDR